MEIIETSTIQQERLQAIAEKRKRQTEIENKRRQLEDDRRQLQHLKSKALRERWLLEGAPSSTAEEGEATKKLMEEDNLKAKELEENIQRLEKELEQLENGISASSTKENMVEETRVVAKEEKLPHTPKTPLGSAKDNKISNSPVKVVEGKGSGLMKAAMYSVEITVEKDKLTGETKVLSSTTRLPKENSVQGVKVYEDELKVVHAVHAEDGAIENGLHQLSSSEVDELIHKADEVTLSEVSEKAAKEALSNLPSQKVTPRKEITGVQAKPMESPKLLASSDGPEPSKEQPVTMIFMGYQNVEDENETKKVLGLEGEQIKAELVVIEDAENKPAGDYTADHAPPNGSAMEPLAQKEENQTGAQPSANDTDPKGADQDLDMKKQRCKCCSVM
ncbi:paralemmin-1 isoform X2 [Python bivittatus]|uniref:Paralemmin-1 n=1 Tax=Python bivittatus TaxID=176946 RepID=A0A9F2R6C4_PYTBI|nr:paralemmin-1 isoform X2 [Python bivittatus]